MRLLEGPQPLSRGSGTKVADVTVSAGHDSAARPGLLWSMAMKANVGSVDRIIRIALGLALLALIGVLDGELRWLGLIGLVPLLTGVVGWCPAYGLFGVDTC